MTKPTPPVTNPHCQPDHPGDLLRARAACLQRIRHYFLDHGFLEVETPTLIPQADPSPHLASFSTWYQPSHYSDGPGDRRLFLRTSPEFAMKQLVAAGYPRIFQLCKFFRNGESTSMHNPEFTGLEWYEAECDYHRLMERTEAMCRRLWAQDTLTYQGITVDLSTPWERLTIHEAFARYAQIKLPPAITREALANACLQRGLPVKDTSDEAGERDSWDDLFFKLFLTYVEPYLGMERPTFLMDYPIELAALSRAKPGAPHIAERVELYIAGVELANGYSELTDAAEQRRRMEAESAFRRERGEAVVIEPDAGLLNALAWGMPPTAGIAVGVDRLIMLTRDAPTIQDVLPFPISSFPPAPESTPGPPSQG